MATARFADVGVARPDLFEAAFANPFVHTLQHASFLLTALLFWRGIVGEAATRRASGQAMLSLFTTMVHTGALGALITLASGVWYPSYIEPMSALGAASPALEEPPR